MCRHCDTVICSVMLCELLLYCLCFVNKIEVYIIKKAFQIETMHTAKTYTHIFNIKTLDFTPKFYVRFLRNSKTEVLFFRSVVTDFVFVMLKQM